MIKKFFSRRLWSTLIACIIVWACLERGVNHLYALQNWQSVTYGSMFLAAMGAITAVVCRYVGIKDISVGTHTNIEASAHSVSEQIFEHIPKAKHFDDETFS